MAEQSSNASQSTGHRGTGFPGLPLDVAVEAVKSAGQYGLSHSDAAFAGYLGHSSANSGPFRAKMAALRDWGLIERPRNGQVPLTELGQQLAHPTGDETPLLQRAFSSAKAFSAIYEESAKGVDLSLDLLANRAVTTLGVSPQNKSRFVDSFGRSVVVAGLGTQGPDGTIRLVPPGSAPPAEVENDELIGDPPPEGSKPVGPTTGSQRRPSERDPAGHPPAIHQKWTLPAGHVLFEVSIAGPLPGAAFVEAAKVIASIEEFVSAISDADSAGQGSAFEVADASF